MNNFQTFFSNMWKSIVDFFNANGNEILVRAIYFFAVLLVGHYLIKLIIYILRKMARINPHRVDRSAPRFFISVINIVLRIVLVIILLAILDVDLSGLSMVVSSAVLAIGLSLQDVVGNFAAGVQILTAKPFLTGNYIEVDGTGGTVEDIGMMMTTLITPNNQKVVIPNKRIVTSVITNYNGLLTRRASISLTFDFTVDIDKVQSLMLDQIKTDSRVLRSPDPVVVVNGFSDRGVEIVARFYSRNDDYWDLLFTYQKKILQVLIANGINPNTRVVMINEKK